MKTNDLQKMLTDAAEIIIKQSEYIMELERDQKAKARQTQEMQNKLAQYQRKEDCEKLANVLIDKGVVNPSDYRSKVQELYSGEEDIALLTKAAELIDPKSSELEFISQSDSMTTKTADEIAIEKFNNIRY